MLAKFLVIIGNTVSTI